MSYHVVIPRFGFKELPDRVLVREDGAYGDHKAHGTPMINYWYMLEQRIPPTEREIISAHLEQLEVDNAKLRELCADLRFCKRNNCLTCSHGRFCNMHFDERFAELGIEVDE